MVAEQEALPGAPDVAGMVVGWRSWTLVPDAPGPSLHSPLQGTPWPAGGSLVATCEQPHDVPSESCTCGLHAARDLPAAARAGGDVLGLVALWGTVVEGERGWRATSGRPRLLLVGPEVPLDRREQLARRYQVPVHAGRFPLVGLAETASGVRTREGDTLADRAAAVVAEDAAGAENARDLRDPRRHRAVGSLLDAARPGFLPRRLASTGVALVALCLLPDLWATAMAWVSSWAFAVDGWRSVAGPLAFVAVFLMLKPGWGFARHAAVRLRMTVRGTFGLPGSVVGLVLLTPLMPLVLLQPPALWMLLSHGHPAWLPILLAAPVLVSGLGLVMWSTTRPPLRSLGRPAAGVLALAVVAVVGVGAVAAWGTPAVGEDVAFFWAAPGVWQPHAADNGPPGTCLAGRDQFLAADRPAAPVECSEPHWGEVLGDVALPSAPVPWPGDDAVADLADRGCDRLQAAQDPEVAGLELHVIYPGREIWEATDRYGNGGVRHDSYAACAVSRRDGAPLSPGTHVRPDRAPAR